MTASSRIVIIGGGITGLSAGWYIQRAAKSVGTDVQYTILEQSDRWGGKIRTEQIRGYGDPFVVEAGPDSFLTQKPWALALARQLGLEAELIGTTQAARRVFVLNHGKLTPMPEGVSLIVPTRFMPFIRTPLLSPLGKLRMGLDLFIGRKSDTTDETLADFVRRRLGSEALDKIAEPLLSGIYSAEPERQSLLATFPRFRDLEQQYGSLIRGMLASRRANGLPTAGVNGATKPASAFMTLLAGTERLVQALVAQLTCDLRLNTKVAGITRATDGTYTVALATGESIRADA